MLIHECVDLCAGGASIVETVDRLLLEATGKLPKLAALDMIHPMRKLPAHLSLAVPGEPTGPKQAASSLLQAYWDFRSARKKASQGALPGVNKRSATVPRFMRFLPVS